MASTIRGSDNFDSGWGNGQTWQSVTGSRASGTTYTNTTGKPIQVSICVVLFTTTAVYNNFYVNGVLVSRPVQDGGAVAASTDTICAIVPNGATYQFTGTSTINSWAELR